MAALSHAVFDDSECLTALNELQGCLDIRSHHAITYPRLDFRPHEGMERLTRAVRAWRSPAALASVQRWLSDEIGAGHVSMLHELGRDDPF